MAWDLPEFDRKRLEKGRKLLQESEEHRGSRDLQLYVESMDLTVHLHRIFVDGSNRPQGLTAQEKLQGLVVLMHMSLRNLSSSFSNYLVDAECGRGMADAISELHHSTLPWAALVANIGAAVCNSLQISAIPSDRVWAAVELAANLTAQPDFSAVAAALELHQRSSGFDPVLSAADMRLLVLYVKQDAAQEVLRRQPAGTQHTRQRLAAGLSANRQLLQLDPPAAACLHFKRCTLMSFCNRRPDTVAALRSALREAPEHKSHAAEAMAAQQLAYYLVVGFAGPRLSVEEVRGLLKNAKTALAKCKLWTPPPMLSEIKAAITRISDLLEAGVAHNPGAATLTALERGNEICSNGASVPQCSGCSEYANSLKKCSSCGVAAYCSRACQVRHWKEGGHKHECAQLAAGGDNGGAGSSRG